MSGQIKVYTSEEGLKAIRAMALIAQGVQNNSMSPLEAERRIRLLPLPVLMTLAQDTQDVMHSNGIE